MSRTAPAPGFLTVLGVATGFLLGIGAASPACVGAQWSRPYETAYLPGDYNWKFRDNYRRAADLVAALDYGQGVVYETLWATPNAPVGELETRRFALLTGRLLVKPPRLPVTTGAVAVAFAKLVPEAAAMFDWTHVLQRQVYDVLADPSLDAVAKDGRMVELLGHYRSRSDLALSAVPRSAYLTDGQLYSLSFRERYPKINGLVWARDWLQVGVYESLLTGATREDRDRQVDAVVDRLGQMLHDAPASTPYLMPMVAAVAPTFAARYPALGVIFDNLHMMQDVVSDILASREIPRSAKRREILRAAALFRSDTAYTTTYEAWRGAAATRGVDNMGGPAVGFGPRLATPSVARGAPMAEMAEPSMDPAGMSAAGPPDAGAVRAVYDRMMADPVIRERAATDPVLQRLLQEAGLSTDSLPGGAVMPGMDHDAMSGMQPGTGARPPAGMTPDAAAVALGPGASPADRARAIEFVVRLLSDPAVEARIHADPALQRLWSDPDVQRRLAELGVERARTSPAGPVPQQQRPPSTPPPAAPPAHRHP